jgi:hypothetical protein
MTTLCEFINLDHVIVLQLLRCVLYAGEGDRMFELSAL